MTPQLGYAIDMDTVLQLGKAVCENGQMNEPYPLTSAGMFELDEERPMESLFVMIGVTRLLFLSLRSLIFVFPSCIEGNLSLCCAYGIAECNRSTLRGCENIMFISWPAQAKI